MKETTEVKKEPRAKVPLLQKFDIPVDHLDFRYLEKCTDVREVEQILRILRSGEEGHYPELIAFTEERLTLLNPNSRVLRVETPVLKSEYLEKEQKEEILNDLSDWITKFQEDRFGGGDMGAVREIFTAEESDESLNAVPIRGSSVSQKEEESITKKSNPDRIKSWEYDKWEKFDVDAELTRMEVTDMQINEWEKHQKPKVQEEHKKIQSLMKNEEEVVVKVKSLEKKSSTLNTRKVQIVKDVKIQMKPSSSQQNKINMLVDKPSFIEEITEQPISPEIKPAEQNEVQIQMANVPIKPRRRIKIQIEDVHMGRF